MSILLVCACHLLDRDVVSGRFHTVGSAGVTVFFTLSGFLITSLLIEEHANRRRVDLVRFYRNRALRLMPALAFAGVVLAALQVAIGWGEFRAIVPVLLYYANWSTIQHFPLIFFGPTWSLSIEEQFYLAWPIALLISLRWRNGALWLAFAGIVVSTALRFLLYDGGAGGLRVYYGSDTQASCLLVGCLLALLAERGLPAWSAGWARWLVPVGVCGLGALALVPQDYWGDVWVPTLVPVLAAAMIWVVCGRATFLDHPVLRYLGRRSYALYLWHNPMIWLLAAVTGRSWLWGCVAVAVALVIAEFSHRVVEQPFLRRKQHARAAAVSAPPAERRTSDLTPA